MKIRLSSNVVIEHRSHNYSRRTSSSGSSLLSCLGCHILLSLSLLASCFLVHGELPVEFWKGVQFQLMIFNFRNWPVKFDLLKINVRRLLAVHITLLKEFVKGKVN